MRIKTFLYQYYLYKSRKEQMKYSWRFTTHKHTHTWDSVYHKMYSFCEDNAEVGQGFIKLFAHLEVFWNLSPKPSFEYIAYPMYKRGRELFNLGQIVIFLSRSLFWTFSWYTLNFSIRNIKTTKFLEKHLFPPLYLTLCYLHFLKVIVGLVSYSTMLLDGIVSQNSKDNID